MFLYLICVVITINATFQATVQATIGDCDQSPTRVDLGGSVMSGSDPLFDPTSGDIRVLYTRMRIHYVV
jgi:hypothetical protein